MLKKYNDKYYARYGDPRTAQWLLMDNQLYVFILGAAYYVITTLILPRLMRNRNPFNLNKLTILYNFGMMVLNGWILYELGMLTWLKPNFKYVCQSVDWSDSEDALKVANLGWLFLITTFLELINTILLILQKKGSGVPFIHIFLRIQAPILAWYGLKFAPGGYNSLYTLLSLSLNAMTHFHHGALGVVPFMRHPHWEVFTLPALLVLQFTTVFLYNANLHFLTPKGCKPSFFILRLNMFIAVLFFVFARDFFKFKLKNKEKTKESSKSA